MKSATRLTWVKSTHSSGEGGDCVEVARSAAAVHVRDSKDVARPGLAVGRGAWAIFVAHAGNGRVD
ncbi:DUF397 domain-containing protein [Streptomyces tagetis]|uniref:DUF397 domain-containing protein n=1 Tax=Streptomyces tagetis TaxID=2820809 RepID=A0A940XLV5_9ACTN|nr:DUF397 domain-containing protein [Streptomyces sp. RG38]MBQ0830911.1 DUF397 domain-containing protein [Streptomyces sp. RG38]